VKRFIQAEVADFQALELTRKRIATQMSPEGFFTEEEITFYTAHSSEHPLNIYYANMPTARPSGSPMWWKTLPGRPPNSTEPASGGSE
jgi:hypothetical protein